MKSKIRIRIRNMWPAFKVVIWVVLFISSSAFGMKSDYETVSNYHKKEIEQLLKDYTLEDSLTIRIELKRKDEKEAPEKFVNIPGLYQKTGDSPDSKIESVLNLYERKVVLIKKREISEKEMDLVKSSLNERLFMPAETNFTMLDDIPKVGDAVQNMKSDFVFGAYNTLIKNGQFLWILIFSIGFIVALWVLSRVWKSTSEGAGGEISMSGGGDAPASDQTEKDSLGGARNGSMPVTGSDFETFNFESLCANITDAHKKSPGSTAHIMWTYISDLQSQIQFYELIRIQKQMDTALMSETYEVLDKIYAFEERANSSQYKPPKGFDKNTLSTVSVELARLKFIKSSTLKEKAFGALYPYKSDNMSAIFQTGFEDHYIVLYKLFKDDFMNYLSSSNDSSVLDKINDLLLFDPDSDQVSDEQYSNFISFLEGQSFEDSGEKTKTVNSKIVYMIYGLSEEELGRVEAMKSNEDLRAEIPSLDWIEVSDVVKLKSFLLSLNGAELKSFIDYDTAYEQSITALDERTQFRVKEKIEQSKKSSTQWRQMRNKIKKHYSYKSESADEAKEVAAQTG